MNKKTAVRIVCGFLAVLMVVTALAGLLNTIFATKAYAAGGVSDVVVRRSGSGSDQKVDYINPNRNYDISFSISVDSGKTFQTDTPYKFTSNDTSTDPQEFTLGKADNSKKWVGGSSSRIQFAATSTDNTYMATLTNVSRSRNSTSYIEVVFPADTSYNFTIPISTELLTEGGKVEDPEEIVSNTIVESYTLTDKKGKTLEKITKDTGPFSLYVTFLEYGLDEYESGDLQDKELSVFFSNPGGFKGSSGSNRGTLRKLFPSVDNTPRFRATFDNLTYDELGGNAVTIKTVYNFGGTAVQGTMELTVKEAVVDKEKEEGKVSPLKPYIIVNSYTYGQDDIVAGSDFSLSINYTNTSSGIPLENIIMTVTPSEDLSITSSSNTSYIPSLAAKGSLSHKIDLKAKPTAKVGSAEVEVTFKYQYVDSINTTREEVETTEKIAIPLTQIDRFAVDPINTNDIYAMVGETFYLSVGIINRGKSPTYNITANAESKADITAVNQHVGNLEAGKSDTIEIPITPTESGELVGDIIVEYEDESMTQKKIKQQFSIYVEEPYVPDPDDMNMGEMEDQNGGTHWSTVVLSILGGLLIAAPIGYYFMKRSKNRAESEYFDEDF